MTWLAEYSGNEALADATVVDRTGRGNNFSISGTGITRDAAGRSGNALKNSGATAATPPNIGQTANRSVMCWLKGALSTAGWPVQWYNAAGDTGVWGILILSGQVHIRGRNAGGVAAASATSPADWSTTWHHIAGTYDGSTLRLYIDGTLQGSGTALAGPLRTDGVLQLSGYAENNLMSDLRIADHAATAAEIARLRDTPVGFPSGPQMLTFAH